jgi:hypothetical protein
MDAWEAWKKAQEKAKSFKKNMISAHKQVRKKRKGHEDDEAGGKPSRMMEAAANEASHPLARFNPEAVVSGYHFMDERKLANSEFEEHCSELRK